MGCTMMVAKNSSLGSAPDSLGWPRASTRQPRSRLFDTRPACPQVCFVTAGPSKATMFAPQSSDMMANSQRFFTTLTIVLLAGSLFNNLSGSLLAQAPSDEANSIRYSRDIRPLLSDRCFRCHGPDANERLADLRLDSREFALADRDGSAAIVPGAPERSLLIERIKSHDPDERMPPSKSNKPPLNEHEIALIAQWIEAGARYEDHWAFTPPVRPAVPEHVGNHPIDAFLHATLKQEGLSLSAPASRTTLARRLFLTVTGLPPTPEEIATWLQDDRPDAYEHLVDHLLNDEPYVTRHAEHLASIWLDAGRYADTSGIHMDAGRQGWLWRNWLIESIRSDKPFDQFVVEQLAGDLLPEPTHEQIVATGFLRNHVTTDEGGAINEEYLIEYAAERTATVGSVFLGLTVGCARCHDHK
ncbi:MAG TPA: DUF1549 domain-containing protein, partial [Planctomycetes bacterium]|nr:DUF1549 domain-containing protein [Planctomycetota bacterium]